MYEGDILPGTGLKIYPGKWRKLFILTEGVLRQLGICLENPFLLT